ncbi:barstar family protein [Streptomyces sp. NPDC051555]|uniref:barstar family protein n=1 Tax=Streptomyces sp. NPDC051555 TaxID=3365657 RepID=UPI0037A2A757
MKYLLVQEDEEGVEQLWGRCAGVEGLFVEPVPLPREVLTLRGCSPDGALSDILAAPGAEVAGSPRGLGDVCVEVWDGEDPVQWWTLVDAVVLAQHVHQPDQPHQPVPADPADPADPARYDVVLGAGVRVDELLRARLTAPRFELFEATAGARSVGRCTDVEGLAGPREDPAPVPLQLIGCEAAEPLLQGTQRPRRWARSGADLLVLDRHGAVMASHAVGLDVSAVRPSVLGGDLEDITLTDGGDDRPLPAVRRVWETWYQGPPTEPNRWAPYDGQGRAAWLGLTTRAWRVRAAQPDRTGDEHHLDGRFVTDVPGLHCAMAEALIGPGRYFGREWDTFKDCLFGGFGLVPPFTLIWHDSEIARRALAAVTDGPDGRLSYFEEIVQLLEARGVTVVLR